MNNAPFELSIETDAGTYTHGFHLGTEVATAKALAEEAWHRWIPKIGTDIKTVALKRGGKTFVFDGEWAKQPF